MKRLITISLATVLLAGACTESAKNEMNLPNVLFILADDIGYGDLGCYGGNTRD